VGDWSWDDRAILIADGDHYFRRAAAQTLEAAGFRTREAASGREALEVAEDDDIALVVLEVRLRDLSGYEVCRRLKADPTTRNIPVVMLTASSDSQLSKKAFDAGAVACLTKPYQRGTLVNCVDMALASGERARRRLA